MNPVQKILGKGLRFDVSKNKEMKHTVEYRDGYGWADYCHCGRDSFVCQHCGQAKCVSYLSNTPIDGKNTCVQCFNKRVVRNKPNLKGNPSYDLMM